MVRARFRNSQEEAGPPWNGPCLYNLEKAPRGKGLEKSCGLGRGSLGGPAGKGMEYLYSPSSPSTPTPISCPCLPKARLSWAANGDGAYARGRCTWGPAQSQVGEWRAGPEGLMEDIPGIDSCLWCLYIFSSTLLLLQGLNLPVTNACYMECRWLIDKDRAV